MRGIQHALFLDRFPASLQHPFSILTIVSVLWPNSELGVLPWDQGRVHVVARGGTGPP